MFVAACSQTQGQSCSSPETMIIPLTECISINVLNTWRAEKWAIEIADLTTFQNRSPKPVRLPSRLREVFSTRDLWDMRKQRTHGSMETMHNQDYHHQTWLISILIVAHTCSLSRRKHQVACSKTTDIHHSHDAIIIVYVVMGERSPVALKRRHAQICYWD